MCSEVKIELVWVLESSYKYLRDEISGALLSIVTASQLAVETADDIAAIVHLYQNGGFDFADHMISRVAVRSGADVLKTFDQKLAKLDGVKLLGTTH